MNSKSLKIKAWQSSGTNKSRVVRPDFSQSESAAQSSQQGTVQS